MNSRQFAVAMALIALGALASGCTTLNRPASAKVGSTPILMTPGDVRVITERVQPTSSSPILCAEPSPDVSKALALLMDISAKTKGLEAGAGFSSSENVSILAGRTTAVVGFRDALYRACEAYANGALPKSAYPLILSQYGDLLVTLMLGEAAGGVKADAVTAGAAPQAPTLQFRTLTEVTGSAEEPAKPDSAKPADPKTPADSAKPVSEIPGVTALAAADMASDTAAGAGQAPTTTKPEAPAPADAKPAAEAGAPSQTGPPPSGSAVAEIARLYFDAARGRSIGALLTLCASGNLGSFPADKEICGRVANLVMDLANPVEAQASAVRLKAEEVRLKTEETRLEIARLDLQAKQKAAASPKPAKPKARRNTKR